MIPSPPFRAVHEPGSRRATKPCVSHSHAFFPSWQMDRTCALILSSKHSDDHSWTTAHVHALVPIGCVCVCFTSKSPILKGPSALHAHVDYEEITGNHPRPLSGGKRLPIAATSELPAGPVRVGSAAACFWRALQSSSSLPEATLSSMASRMAFSSNTGPCPSHLARCFSRLLMSAMSTRPLLYRSWLMM